MRSPTSITSLGTPTAGAPASFWPAPSVRSTSCHIISLAATAFGNCARNFFAKERKASKGSEARSCFYTICAISRDWCDRSSRSFSPIAAQSSDPGAHWGNRLTLLALLLLGFALNIGPLGISALAQPNLMDGLVAYYPFDGNANDLSGHGYNGIVYGAMPDVNQAGQPSSSFRFTGTTNWIRLNIGFEAFTNEFTVATWVKADDFESYYPSILSGDNTCVNLYVNGSEPGLISLGYLGKVYFYQWAPGSNPMGACLSTTSIHTNQWHHVAATRVGVEYRLYLDGVLSYSTNENSTAVPTGSYLQVGNALQYHNNEHFFHGNLDDLRIYNRALSSNEVQALYVQQAPPPPRFLLSSVTVPAGTNVTLSATALEMMPDVAVSSAYQWLRNGTSITNSERVGGATSGLLTISEVQPQDTGAYSVQVTRPSGATTSVALVLTVYDGDSDGDGLPNSWEAAFGLNPADPADAQFRPDGDQLAYLLKYRFGLNPLAADTENDGLNDYDEVFVHATNPLSGDTDGDGIPDKWEVDNGLNPRANDANDDFDLDGLTNLQEYQNRAAGYRIDQADSLGDGRSDSERFSGSQTNRFYYDRNDRLLGADYNHGSNGFGIAYVYDGNGNLLRQKNLVRDANTNGLPDVWEFLNGLTNNANAYADTDGDGWSNYQEWKAASSPSESGSRPELNPGVNVASLQLPFIPSNFVVGVGQLDGVGADEIVFGADGVPGTNTNFLLILTQGLSNWSTQRVEIGPFGITSIAVGQMANRPTPAIYAGLRQQGGAGRIMELMNLAGIWQTHMVAESTNEAAFVIGVRGNALLASLASTNAASGSLFSLLAGTNSWTQVVQSTNVSSRGLGALPKLHAGWQPALRLLDSGGVEIGDNRSKLSLVACWSFDDGTAADISGNGNDGTIVGAVVTNGIRGGALHFNGINNYVAVPTPRNLRMTNEATFEAWIHPIGSGAFNGGLILAKQDEYWIQGGSSDSAVHWAFANTDPGWVAHRTSALALQNEWSRVTVVYSVGKISTYINGVLRDTYQGSGSISHFGTPSDRFYIGSGVDGGNSFPGIIDEASVYSRALTADEVADEVRFVLLSEPPGTRRNNWRGTSLASGSLRGTNASSVLYTFADDKNADGVIDFADDFVLAEYLVNGTNQSVLTLSRQRIASTAVAQSYGLATVNFHNRSNEVFFTGEPDGLVFAWTATGATNPLQRQLFSSHHAGKAWHALAAVKTSDPGDGLVGLRVDPTVPNACDLILWPPQSELPQLVSPPQTPPIASVLPQAAAGGTLLRVRIRLWDAEGNASAPFLQYQLPGSTNWQDAAISRLDDAPYSPANKVTTLPDGIDHVLTWSAIAVFTSPGPTNLWLRVRAQDHTLVGDWSAPMPYSLTIPADTDGDGLPDDWEQSKLLKLDYAAGDDPDLDGFTNLQEYLADTDPLVGASHLRITGVSLLPGGLKLDWQGGVEATQILQRNLSVGGADSWLNIHTAAPPTSTSGSYTDVLGTNALQFYRLKVNR